MRNKMILSKLEDVVFYIKILVLIYKILDHMGQV